MGTPGVLLKTKSHFTREMRSRKGSLPYVIYFLDRIRQEAVLPWSSSSYRPFSVGNLDAMMLDPTLGNRYQPSLGIRLIENPDVDAVVYYCVLIIFVHNARNISA